MGKLEKIIQGSGGGGKGGGGSARVAVESPNTLQSKQYARVLDLVSEGEISGLVNGLKSVYLDGTPIQNADGTYNFTGVNFDYRVGTQSQSPIAGFTQTESESAVSTELKNGLPLVRTINNANNTSARVTVSLPALTYQNTSNGDLSGTSVELAIDLQNNGGGFVAMPLRIVQDASKFVIDSSGIGKNVISSNKFAVTVNWTGQAQASTWWQSQVPSFQSCVMQLQYRLIGNGSWIIGSQYTFSGSFTYSTTSFGSWAFSGMPGGINGNSFNGYGQATIRPPFEQKVFSLALTEGLYEFRLVKVSGYGNASIASGLVDVPAYTDIISGKTTSRYQKSYTFALPASGPWDIRVRRITADATTSNIQNKTFWDSYTEIIDAKLRYPNSAVCGIEVDAQQFNSIPSRGFEIKGILVQVPVNYDPLTHTYTGAWNGTFKTAWTNNPAWIFYDMIVTGRYGLGEFISASQVDKWSLYKIGQYCDELVDDGFGNGEPRFTVNLYLQTQEEAYRVLANLASVFRAINYWAMGTITTVQDAPSDPIALFTAANVVGGNFSYQGSSARTRHTVALVTWNDPDDGYIQKVEYVADDEGIARYGVQQTEVVAFGCTSRGQAHRFGKSILYTERMESEVISFRTGLDGAMVTPGAVIQTHDSVRAGKRFGGRIISADDNDVVLDATVTIEAGKSYELSCVLSDGTVESRITTTAIGETSSLHVTPAFSSAPQADAIWILAANDLIPELWRVVGIIEVDKTQLDIVAMAYRADKYDAIERDISLEPLPISIVKATAPDMPIGLIVNESLYAAALGVVGVKAVASWGIVSNAVSYLVEYVAENGNPVQIGTTNTSIDIQPIVEGTYTFSVQAVNALGKKSQAATVTKTIYGKTLPPANVMNFQLEAMNGMARVSYEPATDLDVTVGGYLRIRHSSKLVGATWNSSVDVGVNVPGNSASTLLPLLSGTYLAKWVDSTGNESVDATFITTTAPDILNMNAVELITEQPNWTGTKLNTLYSSEYSGIILDSAYLISQMTANISTWPKLSLLGGVAPYGEYISAETIDLGAVYTSRLTGSIFAQAYDAADFVGERTSNVSLWTSISGDLINDVEAKLYVRTTNDDPLVSPIWSAWQPFFVGDWTARAYQFKAVLSTSYATHNIALKEMTIQIDMPDKLDSGNNIVSGTSTKHVSYSAGFKSVKALAITAENMATGDYYSITNKTAAGFDILFKNAAGTNISRTFDFIARGY